VKIKGYDILCDFEDTKKYRDKYNEKCHCDECKNFRLNFNYCYPEVVAFLKECGINIDFPLEIMDLGFNVENSKRAYCVYYSVKGELPIDKIQLTIGEINIVLRNWNVAEESYSNTGMENPYFIIEVLDLFIKDIQYEFYYAVKTGRKIEFQYNGKNYFVSRNNDQDWYAYCEETKKSQRFTSSEHLLKATMLDGVYINELFNDIKINSIL